MLTNMGNYTPPQGELSSNGSESRPSSRTPLWISLAALGGLLVGVVGALGVTNVVGSVQAAAAESQAEVDAAAEAAAADERLATAVRKCGSNGMELGDEDRTLIIDVKGKDDFDGASYDEQACVLNALDVPASVESHIGQTTSMDGRQSESWDGITIEWSYHPDRGSDMVITLEND
ncbi:hypothetical protein ACFVR6_03365 [Microbacterium sp. NPDC058021]|uniref:hypothetical protein n=1 Tax=Microbacterium sp. NPDC058021 TaxID=3346306 RepID=UPI0036DBDE41